MLRGGLALVFLVLLGAPAFAGVPGPRDVRDVPLIDQGGTSFTLRSVGKPAAVIFVASRCGDACPVAEALFAKLSAELARERVEARLLTVTLEPEYDQPIVMAALAHRFSADPLRWRWASGRPADVRRVLDAFGVVRLDQKFHGAFAYVLDRNGRPARLVLLSTSADRELLTALRAQTRA